MDTQDIGQLVDSLANKLQVPVEHLIEVYSRLWWTPVVMFLALIIAFIVSLLLARGAVNWLNSPHAAQENAGVIGVFVFGGLTISTLIIALLVLGDVLTAIASPEAYAINRILDR